MIVRIIATISAGPFKNLKASARHPYNKALGALLPIQDVVFVLDNLVGNLVIPSSTL